MMLKMLGLGLIVLFCAMCGLMTASSLKGRTQALKKTQLFLHLLTERLNYTLSPVDEIFAGLAGEPLLDGLDYIPQCDRRLSSHTPFPEAFRESVEHCRCPLDRRDRALLCELCGILGASSAENQLEGLALIKANLAEQARAAQEEVDKRAKLYASLGVLSGAAIAIVLI